MLDAFVFVALPYLALASLVLGSWLRYRASRFSYSALSSQFLEGKALPWGSIPWHAGVAVLFLGHLLPFLVPGLWQALVSSRPVLLAVEAVGVAAAILAAVGLAVLLVRRVTVRRLQPVSTVMDVVVVALLLTQVVLGLGVAVAHTWGAQWSVGTTTPYLWSLLTLRPDTSYVAGLPPLVRVHLAGAFLIFALVPFTRLVHLLSIPVAYLWRPPQKVVWASARRRERRRDEVRVEEGRRHLARALAGLGAAGALLSIGVLDKLLRFFSGPEMTVEEEAGLLRKRLERLEMTAEERELQLERMRSATIRVARLGELERDSGTYFIDYQMRPALAFRDADGLPLLISAKCTHLGCTVAKDLDDRGRLLCPCHVSYFDLDSGEPNPGSPAKQPLPHLGWVLKTPEGEVVASRPPGGAVEGDLDPDRLDGYDVFIARRFSPGEVA